MTEKFHEELALLKKEVEKMGELSKDMLEKSVQALKNQDIELANWVISESPALRELDDKIEEEALRLIALHQPMASDMRLVATILKMITYMTRIGRYGNDIAKIALELADQPHIAKMA
ncbi:MAG: phosphate transport system regulatory protein PhoU, partial [Candidatus Thermoplasmatota archaeon]|nr:phosphate transport system regulatory protein PhoU [Candidatus Thermoplasmatota archaeon]